MTPVQRKATSQAKLKPIGIAINDHLPFETRLSEQEREFLQSQKPTAQQFIRFSWQLEALYFLAWCAGLVERIAAAPARAAHRRGAARLALSLSGSPLEEMWLGHFP